MKNGVAFGIGVLSGVIGVLAFDKFSSDHKEEQNFIGDDYFFIYSNGVKFTNDKTVLIYYPSNNTSKTYTIPDSVTSISNHSFSNCTYLESIIIPASVKTIQYHAFQWCNNLTNVTILSSDIQIDTNAFYLCSNFKMNNNNNCYFYNNKNKQVPCD